MTHWIAAPVILPALTGALMVLAMRGDRPLQRAFGLGSVAAQLAIALALAAAAVEGPQAYFMGDWPAPFGIVLVSDRLSATLLVLTAGLAAVVLLYAAGTGWDQRGRHFHALFQFQLMGVNGAFLTADAFNLFVFFEVMLIASYGLMVHGGGGARLRAGVQYIAFNLIASTLFLFALALTYGITGTLTMADIGQRVTDLPPGDAGLIRAAAVMMILVFAIKGALVPLQFWLPGTYALAPGPVAALFAIMTKVGAYAILRVGSVSFPAEAPAIGPLLGQLLTPAALATLAVGALGVLGARSLTRQAAFAAIGSMGVLFLPLAAGLTAADGGAATVGAALYYLVHSCLTGAALFLVADLVMERRETTALAHPDPLPQGGLIAALFMAAAVASAGLPPLSGFLGKLLVLDALRGPGMALTWTAILASSFLMVLGFARAGSATFWRPQGPVAAHGPQVLAMAATGALVAALVLLTLLAGPLAAWLDAAAAEVLDPAAYIGAVMARAGEGAG